MAVVDQYLSGRQLKNLQISLRTAFCVLPKKIASHGVAIVVRFVSSNKTAVRKGGGRGLWEGRMMNYDKRGLGRERENSCILLCTEI